METKIRVDLTDWKLLKALQENGRSRFSELALLVGLTPPAVAERVRRLEAAGVIRGYHADVDPALLGYPLTAIIRLSVPTGSGCSSLLGSLEGVPEVLEAYRVTGAESGVLRAVVASADHLENLLDRLTEIGKPTTGIATSSFKRVPAITPSGTARADSEEPR